MKIREIRRDLDLSQADFAKLLGVHQTAVSQWETGRTFPEMEIVVRIARISGRTINDILDVDRALEPSRTTEEKKYFELTMPDDSMKSARIYKGDTVYFYACDGCISNGMIAAVETQSGVLIRHLFKMDGGYLLSAASPEFPPVFIKGGGRILGRAYAFRGLIS
ncbi:MAG: helix-turn-helix domain-containing protein [Clostridia bacterium]|nr:helix-turn-helix domain-containing protein [Clostridia bacterium]